MHGWNNLFATLTHYHCMNHLLWNRFQVICRRSQRTLLYSKTLLLSHVESRSCRSTLVVHFGPLGPCLLNRRGIDCTVWVMLCWSPRRVGHPHPSPEGFFTSTSCVWDALLSKPATHFFFSFFLSRWWGGGAGSVCTLSRSWVRVYGVNRISASFGLPPINIAD